MDSKPSRATCAECGAIFGYERMVLGGREFFPPVHCPDCADRLEKEHLKQSSEASESHRIAEFRVFCPPEYQDTSWPLVRSKSPNFAAAVEKWRFGMPAPYFIGEAGTCKTRCGFELLRRAYNAGLRVFAVSARRFAWAASRQFDDDPEMRADARDILRRSRLAQVLLLDDLGKEKLTDTVEGELYELLEYRTSHKLPTVWTANSDGAALETKLSDDRRDAILRRLAEFGVPA